MNLGRNATISGQTDYSLGKKSSSFTDKRTFLPALAVMNKKFTANLVGRIWGSNLTQTSIDTMTNVWKKFQTKILKE